MSKSEIMPFVRVALYIISAYLAGKGLPPQAASIIGSDPAVIDVAVQLVCAVVAAVTLVWWRLAKRFGWAT